MPTTKKPSSAQSSSALARELAPHVASLLGDYGESDSFLDYMEDVRNELVEKGVTSGGFTDDQVVDQLLGDPQVKAAVRKAVGSFVSVISYMNDVYDDDME